MPLRKKPILYGAGATCAAVALLIASLAADQVFGRPQRAAQPVKLSAQAQTLQVHGAHTVVMSSVPGAPTSAPGPVGKVKRHLRELDGQHAKRRTQLKHAHSTPGAPRPTNGAQTALSTSPAAGAVSPKTPNAGT